MPVSQPASRWHAGERPLVAALLLCYTLHLLLYAWLVPPWQHYDEPTHLEYALLIRELGRLPGFDEQIPSLRREIARSLERSTLFRNPDQPLTAPQPDDPELELGVNERGHPPLYYVLVAVGTLPWRGQPIESQLLAARGVSVVLALALFGAAYAVLRLLLGERWQLRCAILAALALQPAFADSMSSVNSDVLANLVAVLVLLAAIAVVRRPRWHSALFSLGVLVLAWNSKRTLLVFSLLVPLAWLLAAPRRVQRWALALGCGGLLTLFSGLALAPQQLADWQGTPQALQARAETETAFVLAKNQQIRQDVYPYRLRTLEAQELTFSAWARAEHAVAASPELVVDGQIYTASARLGPEWQQVVIHAPLAAKPASVSLRLSGVPGTRVFFRELVLVPGAQPQTVAQPDGSYEPGLLGPLQTANLVRNASAERRIPALPEWLLALLGRVFDRWSLDQSLSTLFNPRWIAAVYPRQFWQLLVGSWGVFGWGQYSVNPGWFTPLALLALASTVGGGLLLWRSRGARPAWRVAAWRLCALAVLLGWGVALARVHHQPFPGAMFWSFGRYTFVAMLPSLAFFVVGLRAVLPEKLRDQATVGQLVFLLVFALVALGAVVGARAG